jgi:16S rRNA (cytidine1402-2'-O)-methyltransferase
MGPGAETTRQSDLQALAGLAEQELPAGALYVVALPIGNAADMTLRALWVLARVDAIAAEDTRVTGALLARYGIATPRLAVHRHNERAASEQIVARLARGERIALVTDAGTPGVSDPGAVVVRTALAAGCRVVPLPGASAALAALSAAGLGGTTFRVVGFLPAAAGERATALAAIAADPQPSVLFEAPHRIRALALALAQALAPERRVVLARELTKRFETITAHEAGALATAELEERGEYVVLVDAAATRPAATADAETQRWLAALLDELPPARAAAVVARVTGAPRDALYAAALALRGRGR